MTSKKRLPKFKSQEEEAKFWEGNSPLDYLGELKPIDEVFTLAPELAQKIKERSKTKLISLRLPIWEIEGAKRVAKQKRTGYQILIRDWIADSLRRTVFAAQTR